MESWPKSWRNSVYFRMPNSSSSAVTTPLLEISWTANSKSEGLALTGPLFFMQYSYTSVDVSESEWETAIAT